MYDLYKRPVKKKSDGQIIEGYEKLIRENKTSELRKSPELNKKLFLIALLNVKGKPDVLFE